MKLKPSTLFLVLTAIVLGGVVLIVQSQVPPPPSASQSGSPTDATNPENLFAFEERQVQSFSLQTSQGSFKFQRDKDGKWQMLEPEKTAASDASVAFLLNLLSTGKSQRSFTAPTSDRQQYGFQQPLATLEVTLDNKETHKLILGGYDFNRSNLYALADPSTDPKADLKVLLIPPTFESAINRPLKEWKQSAQPQESPSASPNASPSASPGSSPTPSPAASSPAASPSPAARSPSPSPSPDTKPSASGEPSPSGATSP